MTDFQIEPAESEKSAVIKKDELRKPYLKPYLEEMGDLRNLTLGPSPGIGESGFPGILKA